MNETSMNCSINDRRKLLAGSKLNGIDYLEVAASGSLSCLKCRPYLIVYFFNSIASLNLDKNNVRIEGGVKIKNIGAEWAKPYKDVDEKTKKDVTVDGDTDKVLVVKPTSDGDFSNYTLRIVNSASTKEPPKDFDQILSSLTFSFKIDCPSIFDCKPQQICPQQTLKEPPIDYLTKDYASFRRLILDRLSTIVPNWKERDPADVGVMIAELLAYEGDYLSYYQDAVATEAYLSTARSRISVKRIARLLDYYMHSGCNSRVWVCIRGEDNLGSIVPKGTKLLTGSGNGDLVVKEEDLDGEIAQGTKIFETMCNLPLYKANNEIDFYTWGDSGCCLPTGATNATLRDNTEGDKKLRLKVGDVLIFEERSSPSGSIDDKDVSHRHPIRLTKVENSTDELPDVPVPVVKIEWNIQDALPFSLCIGGEKLLVSKAYGNVVLADHGLTIRREKLVDLAGGQSFRPMLKNQPLTFRGPDFQEADSAASAFSFDLQQESPAIYLRQPKEPPANEFAEIPEKNWLPGTWIPQKDLLSSKKFDMDFLVETESNGIATLRFGDDIHGMNPQKNFDQTPLLYAFYRIGNGSDGNVGAESIKRIVNPINSTVPNVMVFAGNTKIDQTNLVIRNPMPAKGGVEPESIAEVQQNAPQAAKINLRAITDADYAEMLKKQCSDVQRAVAKTRWTGSWYTIYVTVDRYGGKPVDDEFEAQVRGILDKYRLSGYDIEVNSPIYVPLQIEVAVNVSESVLQDEVQKALLEAFSSKTLPDGRKGFFHPDNFTFGQPIYLSRIAAAAAEVDGVVSLQVTKFIRTDQPSGMGLDDGVIRLGPYEIFQLENNADYPERGTITFNMTGGR